MTQKACRNCRILVDGDVCPLCKSTALTKTWEGSIMLVNTEGSEVAAEIGVTTPGVYALKIK